MSNPYGTLLILADKSGEGLKVSKALLQHATKNIIKELIFVVPQVCYLKHTYTHTSFS